MFQNHADNRSVCHCLLWLGCRSKNTKGAVRPTACTAGHALPGAGTPVLTLGNAAGAAVDGERMELAGACRIPGQHQQSEAAGNRKIALRDRLHGAWGSWLTPRSPHRGFMPSLVPAIPPRPNLCWRRRERTWELGRPALEIDDEIALYTPYREVKRPLWDPSGTTDGDCSSRPRACQAVGAALTGRERMARTLRGRNLQARGTDSLGACSRPSPDDVGLGTYSMRV